MRKIWICKKLFDDDSKIHKAKTRTFKMIAFYGTCVAATIFIIVISFCFQTEKMIISDEIIDSAVKQVIDSEKIIGSEEETPVNKFASRLWIFVASHNRPCLVNIMSASLYDSHHIQNTNIVVMDHASTSFGLKELQMWFPTAEVIRLDKNAGADMLDYYKHKKFLAMTESIPNAIFVDVPSDGTLSNDWIPRLYEFRQSIPSEKRDNILYTLYNSPYHENVPSTMEGKIQKLHIGFMNSICSREYVQKWIDAFGWNHESIQHYDYQFSMWFKKEGKPILALDPPVSQHIGAFSGSHPNYGEFIHSFQTNVNKDVFGALNLIFSASALNIEIDLECELCKKATSPQDLILLNQKNIHRCTNVSPF